MIQKRLLLRKRAENDLIYLSVCTELSVGLHSLFCNCFCSCLERTYLRDLNKQVGAPTVPSTVIKGSNYFEDFWCNSGITVSHSVTCVLHLFLFHIDIFLVILHFLTFYVIGHRLRKSLHRVTLCHSVTHFMGVTIVPCVTHVTFVTYNITRFHWLSKVSL
jgi:hypothetical protein